MDASWVLCTGAFPKTEATTNHNVSEFHLCLPCLQRIPALSSHVLQCRTRLSSDRKLQSERLLSTGEADYYLKCFGSLFCPAFCLIIAESEIWFLLLHHWDDQLESEGNIFFLFFFITFINYIDFLMQPFSPQITIFI